uniref:Uncharacterized protein n=1 Tax=Salix viminalis TaxID=40686 RepID=A0A6N2L0R3_SALVM
MDSCEEINIIIYIDHVLYEAAAAGDIGRFENDQTCLDRLLTPDESTILHVYLRNQLREPESTDFVDKILERCPALLLQANKKRETLLHLAAKFGHSNVVKVLIGRAKAPHADPESGVTAAKMMLRMTNGEGETALHEAARNARGHVVEILTKEDPDFSYSANLHGETPLYIAASFGWRRGHGKVIDEHGKVIDEILRNCISVDYGGPNGRTALHAAITAGDNGTMTKILKKEKKLTKTTDENGWTPLHYAAYFYWGGISAVKALLKCDASAAYIAETTEKKRTALHIAAIQGYVEIMEEIVSHCPACRDQVDNRGWNALHYVVASQSSKVFKVCLKMIPELERLKTEKDDKGNTPFHLIAALKHKQEEWNEVYPHGKSGIYGLNKQEQSITNIHSGDFGEIQTWYSRSRHPSNEFELSLNTLSIDGEPTSSVSTINRPGDSVLQTTSASLVSSKPARDILHADEEHTVAASTKIQRQSMITEAKPDFEAKLERLKKSSEVEAEKEIIKKCQEAEMSLRQGLMLAKKAEELL